MRITSGLIAVAAAILAALAYLLYAAVAPAPEHPARGDGEPSAPLAPVTFQEQVAPVLAKRCVVCHGCYDAPCQLKLSSAQGIARGASKEPVYDASRLTPMTPTRLFIDATTETQWRRKGFFPVVGEDSRERNGRRIASVLERMIELGRMHPPPPNGKLPSSVDLDINRKLACPTKQTIDDYARNHPLGGMPYGAAPLSGEDYRTLLSWARAGGGATAIRAEIPPNIEEDVEAWEAFLNGNSMRERLVARYLYEHLFLAHIHFEGSSPGLYFRLVRSGTGPGQPVSEIATRHPNNAPGISPFFYRFRPVESVIVHKTHIVFPLDPARLTRLRALFLGAQWEVKRLPPYDGEAASNPFKTFSAIPARARYTFLLENAQYIIRSFIRGPVCRGQVALNVIDDHFFVAFIDPEHDLAVTDPRFLESAQDVIQTPHMNRSVLSLARKWRTYFSVHRNYINFRDKAYFEHDPSGREASLDALWHGDRDNSFLTVFRHFDSASVMPGFVGEIPQKLLVIDYPILERIYYDLVANFDVFGNFTHQLMSRLYMDYLRMEAEDVILSFLPPDSRQKVRATWYRGAEAQLRVFLLHKEPNYRRGTSIAYRSQDPLSELIRMMIERFPQLRDAPDRLNRCKKQPCVGENGQPAQLDGAGTQLRRITSTKGAFVRQMPDLAFLRVRDGGAGGGHAYSIIRNKAHTNVAFIFGEDWRRLVQEDTLTVVKGFTGSYPNFFFDVAREDIKPFVESLLSIKTTDDFGRFVSAYGVRRTSPQFWATSDWFHDHFTRTAPVEAGLFDLSRIHNH